MAYRNTLIYGIHLLLSNATDLHNDEIGEYTSILQQNKEKLTDVVDESDNWIMNYLPPNGKWEELTTNGSVIVGRYRIELCNYGDFAINIYRLEEWLVMLTQKHLKEEFDRLDEIGEEMSELTKEVDRLLNSIREQI